MLDLPMEFGCASEWRIIRVFVFVQALAAPAVFLLWPFCQHGTHEKGMYSIDPHCQCIAECLPKPHLRFTADAGKIDWHDLAVY